MKPLLRLLPYLRPFLWLIVTSGLLAIPLSALRASPALLVKFVGDDLFISKNPQKLLLFPLLFIGLFLANFIVRFFHYYCLRVVVARVNQRVKNDLYEHMTGLSADYFTVQSTGTLISRVGVDPQFLDAGLASINVLIREPITFIFLLSGAFYLNWKLALIMILVFPPLGWVFYATGRNLKRYIARITEENARLYSTLQETFTGIRMVKLFGLEKYVLKRFLRQSETFTKFLLKTAVLEEAAHPMVELITAFAIAGVLYYGGLQVITGTMSPGELMGFFTAFALMVNPLRTLNDVSMKLYASSSAAKRVFEVFDWRPNLSEATNPKPITEFKNEIRLDAVSFAYPDAPEREVLRDVNFVIKKGKITAIVGESGAGKSSLVALLPRIFDVCRGAIYIDGQDIRSLTLSQLRSLIAVVSQDVFLFNDTIEENIRCGNLSATDDEIRLAAKQAHALEFIESLSNGFKTVIGDRGQKLSGGERQRVSIARAFLRKSPLLILDEATSSLDATSEQAVQEALNELMVNRTTIIIAHRLSTIRNADHIVVLSTGRVVESGKHDELIKIGGEYARFYEAHALRPKAEALT